MNERMFTSLIGTVTPKGLKLRMI